MRRTRKDDLYIELIASLINCGQRDVDCILNMMRAHGTEVIDYANEFAEDIGGVVDFGCFVEGVKSSVLDKLEEHVSDETMKRLSSVTIDDNYCAWGGCASFGDARPEEAKIFSEMCTNKVTNHLIKKLRAIDAEKALMDTGEEP